jgi:transcriptional regulator with XRE-family HTH domain
MMHIADRIQTLRKERGLSQEALADQLGVSRQAVSKWESGQSVPDTEKIVLMSDLLHVSTDYLLKGAEPTGTHGGDNALTSKILYIASTALIAIGLLCAFAGWYAEQSAVDIWGSMIIQAVGVAGYYIGKLLSREKPGRVLRWLNIMLLSFMPASLLTAVILSRVAAPYPTDAIGALGFIVLYGIVGIASFIGLKKKETRA